MPDVMPPPGKRLTHRGEITTLSDEGSDCKCRRVPGSSGLLCQVRVQRRGAGSQAASGRARGALPSRDSEERAQEQQYTLDKKRKRAGKRSNKYSTL